jgi:hypothetical protein
MKILVLASFLILSACASLESVSTTSVPAQRSKKISAVSDRFIFLGLNFNNEYVDKMVKDLAQQCPNGRVEGILTKQESIYYFLYFFWTSKVTATGYCVGSNVALRKTGRTPGSTEAGSTEDSNDVSAELNGGAAE